MNRLLHPEAYATIWRRNFAPNPGHTNAEATRRRVGRSISEMWEGWVYWSCYVSPLLSRNGWETRLVEEIFS